MPVAVRDCADTALAAGRASVGAGHISGGGGFVQENQPAHLKRGLTLPPLSTRRLDVYARLLAGVQSFFLNVSFHLLS